MPQLGSKGLHDLQEFNIENANQSDYSRFLSIIAALYLPISYLTVSLTRSFASLYMFQHL